MLFWEEVRYPFHSVGVPYRLIPSVAEDVLADLGVRQAVRKMPKTSRL